MRFSLLIMLIFISKLYGDNIRDITDKLVLNQKFLNQYKNVEISCNEIKRLYLNTEKQLDGFAKGNIESPDSILYILKYVDGNFIVEPPKIFFIEQSKLSQQQADGLNQVNISIENQITAFQEYIVLSFEHYFNILSEENDYEVNRKGNNILIRESVTDNNISSIISYTYNTVDSLIVLEGCTSELSNENMKNSTEFTFNSEIIHNILKIRQVSIHTRMSSANTTFEGNVSFDVDYR